MRRKYSNLLRQSPGPERCLVLARLGFKFLGVLASAYLKKALAGPVSAALTVTWRCNARCVMCDFPRRARRDEMSLEEIRWLIDDLADMNTPGVTLFGGEPLLRKDLFDIIRHAKERRLLVQIPTNGFLITEEVALRLLDSGVDVIAVSLDSLVPERCAAIRGVPDAFEWATRALALLVRLKRERNSPATIVMPSTFGESNVEEMPQLVEFAQQAGIDVVQLMPAQEVRTIPNRFSERYYELLAEGFKQVLRWKQEGREVIDNSLPYLREVIAELEGRKTDWKCFAPYTDVHIDPQGNVFPCAYFLGMDEPWGNVRRRRLKEFWFSEEYDARRRSLAGCRRCGYLCHRELSLLFGRFWLTFPGRKAAG